MTSEISGRFLVIVTGNTQPYDRSYSDLQNQVHWPYFRLDRFGFA